MHPRRLSLALASILAMGLVLGACDEAEQGRILRFEKGTYLGKKDSPLSAEQREELRHRTQMQQGG